MFFTEKFKVSFLVALTLEDGLTGSAWGDWSLYTASPLRAFDPQRSAQNGWLEDYLLFGMASWQVRTVSFREFSEMSSVHNPPKGDLDGTDLRAVL